MRLTRPSHRISLPMLRPSYLRTPLHRLTTTAFSASHCLPRTLHTSRPQNDVTASEQIPRRPHQICDVLSSPGDVDMVSTPDPVSNLRSVKYFIPENESAAERDWRLHRERVDKFNSDFWTDNNTKFITEKIAFEEDARSRGETVTPKLLSVFYKDFLDRAYSRQTEYNRRWWRENLAMLYPGFKASVRNMRRAVMRARRGWGIVGPVQAQAKGIKFWEKNIEV